MYFLPRLEQPLGPHLYKTGPHRARHKHVWCVPTAGECVLTEVTLEIVKSMRNVGLSVTQTTTIETTTHIFPSVFKSVNWRCRLRRYHWRRGRFKGFSNASPHMGRLWWDKLLYFYLSSTSNTTVLYVFFNQNKIYIYQIHHITISEHCFVRSALIASMASWISF